MAYTFSKETAATFKMPSGAAVDAKSLNLKGINANIESADTIVTGIQGLMYITNKQNSYNWGHGVRVVNEDVDYDA